MCCSDKSKIEFWTVPFTWITCKKVSPREILLWSADSIGSPQTSSHFKQLRNTHNQNSLPESSTVSWGWLTLCVFVGQKSSECIPLHSPWRKAVVWLAEFRWVLVSLPSPGSGCIIYVCLCVWGGWREGLGVLQALHSPPSWPPPPLHLFLRTGRKFRCHVFCLNKVKETIIYSGCLQPFSVVFYGL